MKKRILSLCFALLFLTFAAFSMFSVQGEADLRPGFSRSQGPGATAPLPANAGGTDIQFKLALLHLYYESKDIVSTLPFTTIQVSQGALIKAFMAGATAGADALAYIDRYADRTLTSAYGTMDEVLEKFSLLLTRYNIAAASSYTAKYNKLSSMFSSLKNSANELLSRARALIKTAKSNDYDAYYTSYIEQISDMTGKIETYCGLLMDEYDTLLSSISNDYDILF